MTGNNFLNFNRQLPPADDPFSMGIKRETKMDDRNIEAVHCPIFQPILNG